MTPSRRLASLATRRIRLVAILSAVVLATLGTVAFVSFNQEPPQPGGTSDSHGDPDIGLRTFVVPDDVTVTENVAYGARPDGTLLQLDVCSSSAAGPAPRPAVVSIHGGSWTRGDKASDDWREVCEWLASEGFVAYSVDYGLTPAAPFPSGIDDLQTAVEWIRSPENANRFGIDGDRIGAFGGSAGGNLASLLGTRGEGPLTEGPRVAAVAELSGPSDLRGPSMAADGVSPRLKKLVMGYLDCEKLNDCPNAADASPVAELDASDGPVFLANSSKEFVPLEQATRFTSALEDLDIRHELVTVPGDVHSIGLLDAEMRARVAAFLHEALD